MSTHEADRPVGGGLLMLHQGADLYGSDYVFRRSVEALSTLGRCRVVLGAKGPLEGTLRDQGHDVSVMELGVLRRGSLNPVGALKTGVAILVSAVRLARLVKRENLSCVYSNTIGVVSGCIAAMLTRVPHVWHLHEIIESPRWVVKTLTWLMAASGSQIVVVSDATAESLLRARPGLRTAVTVIRNGLDLSEFDLSAPLNVRQELRLTDAGPLVALVARIHYWKGQDLLVEALALTSEDFRRDAHVLLVGDVFPGYEWVREKLDERIAELGLGEHVRFLGYRHDTVAIMRESDIVVAPSTQPDPLPTVVLEAMACARPVVGSDCGGIPEMIVDGETGVVFPSGSPEALAEALERIWLLPDHGRAMGEAGRARIEACFTLTRYERELSDHVLGLLQRTATKR